MKRFVSFLGAGNYQPCRYRRGDTTSPEVVYVQTATNLFADLRCDEAVVFCTAGATERHAKGLLAEFAANGLPKPRLVPIPDGASEAQLWDIFRIVRDTVDDGDEIVFDVTHSFRSLPVIATVLLRYLSVAKGVSLGACMYGAWEAGGKETGVAPIFDLTPFFTLDDWTHAILDFDRSGNPSGLESLAASRLKPLCRTDLSARKLNATMKTLALFARNVRVANLGVEGGETGIRAMSIRSNIADSLAAPGIADGIPELEPVLRRLGKRFAEYGDADVANGFRSARWAAAHGLIPQALTLLQETTVSVVLERHRNAIPECLSGIAAREFVSSVLALASDPNFDWSDWTDPKVSGNDAEALAKSLPTGLAAAYAKLTKRRNAINHAGTNAQEPVSPTSPDFGPDGFLAIADEIDAAFPGPTA